MKKISVLLAALAIVATSSCSSDDNKKSDDPYVPKDGAYTNPVIKSSVPDPTVLRDDDGTYYLYGTEDIHNTPIFKSTDLVNWNLTGTAFTEETRPQMVPGGGIWAPDIQKIKGKYILYYSKSKWGGEWECGIGAAVADKPTGPFIDHGK